MARKLKPAWTEVLVHVPKKKRGFYCWGKYGPALDGYKFREYHYTKQGEVWGCDQCRQWVCGEHWENHQAEHALRQLARNGRL